MPHIRGLSDPETLIGKSPSGKFGYHILKEITKKHHPYNSDANLEVRAYLLSVLRDLNTEYRSNWNCTQPDPFEFIDDNVNMKSSMNGYPIFYESNNILLSMSGVRNESLLISAHFDSAIESYGATDDGIAVASMITVVQSLARKACFEKLPYSVLFNFNNGEENNLQGASALTTHPAYENVKAFINLEGTGVSQEFSSFLFRTNSYSMVSLLLKNIPSPHSSIIANNIMRFLKRYIIISLFD